MADLRARNLPFGLRFGTDLALVALPGEETLLSIRRSVSDVSDLVSLSHAVAGVAESGTVVLVSGLESPTTLSFLPETHIVVVREAPVLSDYEAVWRVLRERHGPRVLPRTVTLTIGPSRSGDIEQKLVLGAQGPKHFHILLVASPAGMDGTETSLQHGVDE